MDGRITGLATERLTRQVRLENRLIFGRQRRVLPRPGGSVRIVLDTTIGATRHGDTAPFALQVRVFGVVEWPRGDWREKRTRQGRHTDKLPEAHACSPKN